MCVCIQVIDLHALSKERGGGNLQFGEQRNTLYGVGFRVELQGFRQRMTLRRLGWNLMGFLLLAPTLQREMHITGTCPS